MKETNLVKIPFWKTVGSAYGILFRNLGEFVRLAWILLIITYGINFGLGHYSTAASKSHLVFLGYPVQFISLSIFAVAWHRMILLNEIHSGTWGYLAFGKRDLLFFLTSVGFTAIIYGFSVAVGAFVTFIPGSGIGAGFFGGYLSLIVLGIVGSRLALIYPRLSVDESFDLSWCWQTSRGNMLRLYFGAILTILPFSLMANLLNRAAIDAARIPGNLGLAVAIELSGAVFSFALIAVTAGFMSLAFRILNPSYLGVLSDNKEPLPKDDPEQQGQKDAESSERKRPSLPSRGNQRIFRLSDEISEIVENDFTEKECPRCAEVIKIRARYCRHCGYEYSDDELATEKKIIEELMTKKTENEKEKLLLTKGINYLGFQIKINGETSKYEIFEASLKLKGSTSYESIDAAKSFIRQITPSA